MEEEKIVPEVISNELSIETNEQASNTYDDNLRNKNDVSALQKASQALREECRKLLIGQDKLVDLLLTCILCDGHALLEGVPGIAKTSSAKVIS